MKSKKLRPLLQHAFLSCFLIFFASVSFSNMQNRFDLKNIIELQFLSPCLLSSFTTPKDGCSTWAMNVDTAPYYDESRRLIFTGAADNYLHVLDADTFKTLALINAGSRVVTKLAASLDFSVFAFGTEKGKILFINPYSYQLLGVFEGDSTIKNDLVFFDKSLFFTTALGTVYSVDATTFKQSWSLTRPAASLRIKLKSNSNILVYKNHVVNEEQVLLVPHFDGYISVIDSNSGEEKQKINLIKPGVKYAFPDIIAPMILSGNSLYVASYDAGLFEVDVFARQIINHKEKEINLQQLSIEDGGIIAASSNSISSLSLNLEGIWRNDFSLVTTKKAKYGFPFNRFLSDYKPAISGGVSKIISANKRIFLASELGGLGIFDFKSGKLLGIKGGTVGFGPNVEYNESLFLVSKTGRLFNYSF